MIFKDINLERKFQKRHLENLLEIGKLYLFATLVVVILYIGFLIYRKVSFRSDISLYVSIPIDIALIGIPILNFLLVKKYQFF